MRKEKSRNMKTDYATTEYLTHGKKSSVLIGQDSFVAYFASVYMDGVEYKALTRPS